MIDKEILDKYIDLDKSCLTEKEKREMMEMLYKYKVTFSLMDEIGTCPNIEMEINMTDRSPFFIRPYHVKEEDKAPIDKEMKHLCYLGILKEGFSASSSPGMLISSNRLEALKCQNSKKQLGFSITHRHILSIGKLQV